MADILQGHVTDPANVKHAKRDLVMRRGYFGLAAAAALVLSTVAYTTPADAQRGRAGGIHMGARAVGGAFAGGPRFAAGPRFGAARFGAGPRFAGARFAAGPRFAGARFAAGPRFARGPVVARGAHFAGRRWWWRHRHRNVWPFAAAALTLPLIAASSAYAYDYGYPYGYPYYASYGGCCPCY